MAQPPKGVKDGDMRIDPALVRELAALLTENSLTEIEVADGERRIKVCRNSAPVIGAPAHSAPVAAAAAPANPAVAPAVESVPEESGTTIKSPMVGTAFLSPQPGAAAFVNVGDSVKAGDTLLIVEAMKVMNPIVATEAGVLKKIMVTDGQPVEFDQPLAVIG